MKAQYIYEKFTEEGDPITDMGIGLASHAIEEIFKEDKTHKLIIGGRAGNIFSIIVSGAAGRGQQHRTGKRFMINFYSNDFYFETLKLKDGRPKRMSGNDKKNYAIELVTIVGIAEFFSDVDYNPHENNVVIFHIKEEYRERFKPGSYGPEMFESLNEKFTKESDPIHDMGIGTRARWFNEVKRTFIVDIVGTEESAQWFMNVAHNKLNKLFLRNIEPEDAADICYSDYKLYNKWNDIRIANQSGVNEKFTEGGDPIQDMNIGIRNQIQKDLEQIGLKLEDVEIDDDFLITTINNKKLVWGTEDKFRDIQLKYLSEEKRKLAKGILRIENLYGGQNRIPVFQQTRKDTLEECIKEALKDKISVKDIEKYIKTFASYNLQKESELPLAKLTRTKKKIKEDKENNVYVFIGYMDKTPIHVKGKVYYEDKFQVEKMVKIHDRYNHGELAQIAMMKMRANAQYGGQSGAGVFRLDVPKFLMDEDYYSEIPDHVRDIVEKYKRRI